MITQLVPVEKRIPAQSRLSEKKLTWDGFEGTLLPRQPAQLRGDLLQFFSLREQ